MRADLLKLAFRLTDRGEPFAFATVVGRRSPTSVRLGDTALVTSAGEIRGWVGGSCTRPVVVREALAALADGRPRRVLFDNEREDVADSVVSFPMTCHSGGSVDVYIDPVLPAPRLSIYGESPVAAALARLASAMGYRVSEAAADAGAGGPDGEGEAAEAATDLHVVVATMGEGDEGAIRHALARQPDYLGVVASSRRFEEIRRSLESGGLDADRLAAVRSPAGLDIGARSAEEIALSILVEIVAVRAAARRDEDEETSGLEPRAAGAADGTARDPVCGMTVVADETAPSAEHGGRTWYFCCDGCRERFLAEPEGFAEAAGGSP